jgi:hypothetical protein
MKIECSAGLEEFPNLFCELLLLENPVRVISGTELRDAAAAQLGAAVGEQHLAHAIEFQQPQAPIRGHE